MMPGHVIQPFPPGLTVPPPMDEQRFVPQRQERPVQSDYAKLRDRRAAIMVSLDHAKRGTKQRGDLIERLRAITAEMLKMEMGRR